MATLSRSEAKTHRAQKHARSTHTCPICGQICRGNGGWSSHKNWHLRKACLPKGDFGYLVSIALGPDREIAERLAGSPSTGGVR